MSRKRWKGILLNEQNIDEYMDDLINDTKGQFITQGVSFNKNDPFQMTLLKNALISHGSFSGFVKHLMFTYFEKNNSFQENAWKPKESETLPAPPPTQKTIEQDEIERKKEQLRAELLILENESNSASQKKNDTDSSVPPIKENQTNIKTQIVEVSENQDTTKKPERKAKFRDGASLGEAILPKSNK